MRRTELLQEVRKMRFEEAYGWQERRLTQEGGGAVAGGVRAHVPALRGPLVDQPSNVGEAEHQDGDDPDRTGGSHYSRPAARSTGWR